jgi:D-xylose 1-dehydrogenase (NADP+, D-xylono-1,5-lactone-forming)
MADKVRWGILGCANIVRRRFMPGIGHSRNAEVIAIASREAAKAEAFASELGISRSYGSYEALLNDPDVEAVYVPLPNWLHAEWVARASEKGKHVLSEKPLAVDEKEVRQLMDVCHANGTLLMEGFMYRFHPRTLKAKEIVDSGKIGDPRVFRAVSGHPLKDMSNIRYGEHGGALMDVGCYCVNAAHIFFGQMPVAVFGRWHKQRSDGVDTTFAGMLEFPQGRIALFDCSFEYSYRDRKSVV